MRWLALACAVSLALGAVLGGRTIFGRTLLALHMPGLAALVLADPAWRGVARYRAGDHAGAAADFAAADAPLNLGNAEARSGRYAAALEAYDIAIHRGDARARANFDLVAAYYAGLGIDVGAYAAFPKRKNGPEVESFVGQGDGRAAGTGDAVTNTNTMLGLAELDSRGRLGVRRVFDDSFIVADERWLRQLKDVPGAYMQARIAEEQKRRRSLGLAPPPPEDPQ